MPKKKQKRKPNQAAYVAQTESTQSTLKTKVIKWSAIAVILAILLSIMIAAISASPSSASELRANSIATASSSCPANDTDGDAITNDVDSDIDGDGVVNGLDSDIDGDKIENSKDGDPAATNCGQNEVLPIMPSAPADGESNLLVRIFGVAVVALLGFGYLMLRRIRAKKN